MKTDKILMIFLVLIFSIYVASAADSADIVEGSVNVSGQQGTTASGSFTLNNTGTSTTTYSFTRELSGPGALSINDISEVTLAIDTPTSVNFNVPIDGSQTLGVYSGTIKVTNSSSDILYTLPITVNVTPSFSVSSSVSSFIFENVQRNTTKTGTFILTNDGNGDLTNVVPGGISAIYNVQFNNTGFTLNKGESETLSFNFTVPFDEPTTNHSIGSISIVSNEFSSSSLAKISIDVKGGLVIDDFDVRIFYNFGENDGDTDVIQGVVDGQNINFDDDVRPGSELRFNIDVENTFTSSEDIDIEDVTVRVTIEEIDDGEDLDEEGDEFDLNPGEEERTTVFFDIPLEVEEGDYEVLVEVEGVDDEGTEHSLEWNLEITINKERRNVIISRAGLTRDTISCSRDTRVNLEVLNIGSKEEDDIKVEIKNDDLGINFVQRSIELETDPFDNDDEYRKSLSISVGSEVAPGTYPIKVNLFISSGALFGSETLNLVVNECGAGSVEDEEIIEEDVVEEEEREEEETVSVQEPEVTEEEEEGIKIPILEESITETKEPSFGGPIILSMVIAGFAAIVIGVFVALKFTPKKEI